MKSAGAVCDAIDAVMAGNFHNSFCIIRPPGHHAGRHGLPRGDFCGSQFSQGFCILNNIAIGTFHALIKYSGLKVAIIDIDLHAGNGTQDILEGFLFDHAEYRNSILFASIHQLDIFPFLSDNRLPPNGVDPSSFINLGLTGIVDSNKWRHHIQSSIFQDSKHLVRIWCYYQQALTAIKMIQRSRTTFGWAMKIIIG